MKTTGIKIPGFKLAKDGKTPIRDEKQYDVSTRLKRKRAPRKKYAGVAPAERDFRG